MKKAVVLPQLKQNKVISLPQNSQSWTLRNEQCIQLIISLLIGTINEF